MIKNNIRKLRAKNNLRQEDLGAALGIPKSLVSMIENGRAAFEPEELMRAAFALGCREIDIYPPEIMLGLYGIDANGQKVKKPKVRPNFIVRLPDGLGEALDEIVKSEGYASRTEAAGALVREGIKRRKSGA